MKKFVISIMTIIFIISMITVVNAANASLELSTSANSVIKGKTFTVTIAGAADNNISALQAKLSYDSNKLSIESKAAGANFNDMSGTSEIAILSSGSDLSKSATLYTITFKVLDNATEGETTISVTDPTFALVNSNQEQENVKVANDSVTITIKADETTAGGEEKPKEEKEPEQQEEKKNETPSNTTNNSNNKSNTNNTTKKTTKKLPQTGIEDTGLIAIVALGFVSIISYISYRKYKNI